MMISILVSTYLSSIMTQSLIVDGSLTALILVGGIAIGLAIGIGLGASLFGLKFWRQTYNRVPAEVINTDVSAVLPLTDARNSVSTLEPQMIKLCVECGKALPLDANYCSECGEEQQYS
jgi:ribosomal protein L40E